MMAEDRKSQLSKILGFSAGAIDIPSHLLEEAVRRYGEVGQWLGAADSPLFCNSPEIYPQGSARLGTMTRPLTDKDEYDIDLVCSLQLKKESISQKELKNRVGDRLRQNEEYCLDLDEGRRCWVLHMDKRFHMDVLPAIPDNEGRLASILITDKELTRWQHSDPKGYANWFWTRMEVIFNEEKQTLAKAMQVEIEDVPDSKVKTPLQQSIQILKRHRDIYFKNDLDDRPISIIISTLAAWAYMGQADLFDALVNIVRSMPDQIEKRNGVYWVANPVNEGENFADKWQGHPHRREKLFSWFQKLDADLKGALEARGINEVAAVLSHSLGQTTVSKAVKTLGTVINEQRQSGKLYVEPGSGIVGSVGLHVRPHTFYGALPQPQGD